MYRIDGTNIWKALYAITRGTISSIYVRTGLRAIRASEVVVTLVLSLSGHTSQSSLKRGDDRSAGIGELLPKKVLFEEY